MVSRVLAATPPSVPEDGEGRTKALRIDGEPRHARLVAEDRAAGAGRGRIDRQHGDLVALAVRKVPSASMVVDLPAPGAPVMPSRTALPVAAAIPAREGAPAAVVGALAFDQRDGARQRRAFAGADAGGEREGLNGRAAISLPALGVVEPDGEPAVGLLLGGGGAGEGEQIVRVSRCGRNAPGCSHRAAGRRGGVVLVEHDTV